MTKPCADKWDVLEIGAVSCGGAGLLLITGRTQPAVEAAQLASAAPDMARALLAVEWSGRADYVGDGGYACCPSCEGVSPEEASLPDARFDVEHCKNVVGHKPECALDAALRKAGVR